VCSKILSAFELSPKIVSAKELCLDFRHFSGKVYSAKELRVFFRAFSRRLSACKWYLEPESALVEHRMTYVYGMIVRQLPVILCKSAARKFITRSNGRIPYPECVRRLW
jgi:hypothetical protein